MNIRYKLCFLLYYGFARHLPKSTVPVIGTAAKRMRGAICRHILGCCGSGNNIEQGAYIGNGKDVRIGNNVGLGRNFKVLMRMLTIGDNVMMGEDVLFLGGGHRHSRTDVPMNKQGSEGKTPFKTLFSAHIEPYPFNILYIYKNVLFIACISSL